MKNILTNKKILVIITIFAIIMGFGSNVFANFDFSYNGNNYSLPDLPLVNNNYFIFTYTSNEQTAYYIYYFDNPENILFYENGGQYILKPLDTSIDLVYCSYKLINSNWSVWDTYPRIWAVSGSSFEKRNYSFLYSTFDLKNQNGEVVFQGAPQVQEETTILAPIVEQAETEKTLAEILGILPLIVALLISIIAIRKAINFLKNVLKIS